MFSVHFSTIVCYLRRCVQYCQGQGQRGKGRVESGPRVAVAKAGYAAGTRLFGCSIFVSRVKCDSHASHPRPLAFLPFLPSFLSFLLLLLHLHIYSLPRPPCSYTSSLVYSTSVCTGLLPRRSTTQSSSSSSLLTSSGAPSRRCLHTTRINLNHASFHPQTLLRLRHTR